MTAGEALTTEHVSVDRGPTEVHCRSMTTFTSDQTPQIPLPTTRRKAIRPPVNRVREDKTWMDMETFACADSGSVFDGDVAVLEQNSRPMNDPICEQHRRKTKQKAVWDPPCECGNPEPDWHYLGGGARYCCDNCWAIFLTT